MSRALARHLEHARDPAYVFEPRDVIGMRKALNDWAHAHGRCDSDADAERDEQCRALLDALATIPHAISPEFTAKGLKWFNAMRIQTRPGAPWRDTALTRQFDIAKRDILSNFERFEFVGFASPSGRWYWPVYRVHGNNEHFDYCYGSWQSGQERIYFPRDPVHVEPGKVYQINPSKCPHFIMVPEHYRNDGSCLCYDPSAKIMRTWGYKWSKAKGVWS